MRGTSLLAILGVLTVSGCSDSTGLSAEQLNGTWNANEFRYTSPADPTQTVDIISSQGASFTVTVASDSTVSTVMDDGQGGSSSDSGTFDATASVLTLGSTAFTADRAGDRLTLVDTASSYDFDSNGSDDPATLTISLIRQ